MYGSRFGCRDRDCALGYRLLCARRMAYRRLRFAANDRIDAPAAVARNLGLLVKQLGVYFFGRFEGDWRLRFRARLLKAADCAIREVDHKSGAGRFEAERI